MSTDADPAEPAAPDARSPVSGRATSPGSWRTRLPPLNALRAFHVVFECRSLRKAGEELLVTPQAVGQQIKSLEESLGVALFIRAGRALHPTEAAVLLAAFVKSGFEELAEGVRRVSDSVRGRGIRMNVSPFFAAHHLIPMLSLSRPAGARAEISLSTAVSLPDFEREQVDLAIQWGYGDWPEHESTLLLPDPKVLCCTPAMASSVRVPADLLRVGLLDLVMSKRLWPDIFRHLGLVQAPPAHEFAFDDAATMRRATVQGIGVGLLSEIDADEDIRRGALVAPLGRDVLAGMPSGGVPGFYLVAPRAQMRVSTVADFRRWLLNRPWGERTRRES